MSLGLYPARGMFSFMLASVLMERCEYLVEFVFMPTVVEYSFVRIILFSSAMIPSIIVHSAAKNWDDVKPNAVSLRKWAKKWMRWKMIWRSVWPMPVTHCYSKLWYIRRR